jgi:hypothetical protein
VAGGSIKEEEEIKCYRRRRRMEISTFSYSAK